MLDILEHFTREELYPLLESVVGAGWSPAAGSIASVPNADSPQAARLIYADITHDDCFYSDVVVRAVFLPWIEGTGLSRPLAGAQCRQLRSGLSAP